MLMLSLYQSIPAGIPIYLITYRSWPDRVFCFVL